jgi:SAM-dependent methyltransferase
VNSNNPNVEVFNRDASAGGSYVYTSQTKLSCRLATERSFNAILGVTPMRGRSILDMGCGDGYYTVRYWDEAKPRAMTGVDGAAAAIKVADERKQSRPIRFEVADVHKLPFADDAFDLALVQSVLHHDDRPADIIREAFRVAPVILIHEPNGSSPGLKFLEKASRYHREHGEKSYTAGKLAKWVENAGGRVQSVRYAGFVPMFCPDWIAKTMKVAEPLVESTPLLRTLGCAVYVMSATRK